MIVSVLRRVAPQLITLFALIVLITLIFPSFLNLSLVDGRLVGPLVDVPSAAPVALLAVGMTLVIATKGSTFGQRHHRHLRCFRRLGGGAGFAGAGASSRCLRASPAGSGTECWSPSWASASLRPLS